MQPSDRPWWQSGIIYQIYPRSFQDSTGDGVGDLPGIRRRLDYVQSLDVEAIWLSPIYPSPMADFGYDVADYKAIHPMFGTMADFDGMLAEIHERGMKLILDLVPNHTAKLIPGFRRAGATGTIRSVTGTSGPIRPRTAARPTTGSASLAVPPGSLISRPANITFISSPKSNQI